MCGKCKKNAKLKRNEVPLHRWSLYLNYSHWVSCAGGKENKALESERKKPGMLLGHWYQFYTVGEECGL